MKPFARVVVTEDVVGYYVKQPCKAQVSITIPKRKQGTVFEMRGIDVAVNFDDISFTVCVPKGKLEMK